MQPAVRLLTPADAEASWHIHLEELDREPRAFARSLDERLATTVADIRVIL